MSLGLSSFCALCNNLWDLCPLCFDCPRHRLWLHWADHSGLADHLLA